MLAATIAEITLILRIDTGDHYVISKALETGAEGILVSKSRAGKKVKNSWLKILIEEVIL